MGQPVLVLWLNKAKESWYSVPEEERQAMFAKLSKADEELGGKSIVNAGCEWSTPQYDYFGVYEYPSIEAVQKYFAAQRESGFSEHMESIYVVGTPWGS